MEDQKYLQDLKDIKDIMDRSSRFRSLSGLSGIFAGIFSLIAAYLIWIYAYKSLGPLSLEPIPLSPAILRDILLIACGTILLTFLGVYYFNRKEARKRKQKLWGVQSKRAVINLAIPLISGGLLCLILLLKGYVGFMVPLTLIFYGLAQVNASNNTYKELRIFGILAILLGLLSVLFLEFSLLFWAIGFGVINIFSGIYIQIQYNL